MGSDRRTFFNQLVNVGALSGLATMLPSDAFAKIESVLQGGASSAGIQAQSADGITRTHTFHAHAHILRSDAGHPLAHDLGSQGFVRLPDEGGFRSQFLESYQSGDGISFKSAYMHVAGARSSKAGYGWITLATSVVTGLNVHDMVTADLVFAQVSTEHPVAGHVPSVTFLGTRFENLRIAGRAVEPVLDLGIVGTMPDGDKPYVQDQGFLSRVSEQYDRIRNTPGLSDSDRQQYHWDSAAAARTGKVECSLVTSVGQAVPGSSHGHIVEVPGFGRVSLAKLTVGRAFHLAMVEADASSSGGGNVNGPVVYANGHSGTGG
jgi:hypothetical protein